MQRLASRTGTRLPFASRLAALAVVGAVVAAGTSACANGVNAQPASAALRGRSASTSPSATPSPPGMQAIQVASPPQHIQALGGALADAGTNELLWSRGLNTELPEPLCAGQKAHAARLFGHTQYYLGMKPE